MNKYLLDGIFTLCAVVALIIFSSEHSGLNLSILASIFLFATIYWYAQIITSIPVVSKALRALSVALVFGSLFYVGSYPYSERYSAEKESYQILISSYESPPIRYVFIGVEKEFSKEYGYLDRLLRRESWRDIRSFKPTRDGAPINISI